MTRSLRPVRSNIARVAVAAIAAAAGLAAAALVGVALAQTFSVQVARNAEVTNQSGTTKRENIAVNSRGFAVYTLTGDSKSHPECTKASGCFSFWPAVASASGHR